MIMIDWQSMIALKNFHFSSSIMAEIADLTYNATAFPEIMGMLWKRLSDHGKNWRHVYKSLMLLDYLVKTGSERVSNQCKENIYAIQTLKDFQFTDTYEIHKIEIYLKSFRKSII